MLAQSKLICVQEGTKVVLDTNVVSQSPRIWLSSGTTREIQPLPEHIKYRPDSFVPKEPWKEPNPTEYHRLGINEPLSHLSSWDLGSYIGVCRFPDEILAPLEVILEELNTRTKTLQYYPPANTHPEYQSAMTKIINYLSYYCLSHEPPKLLGLQVTLPGLRTLTMENADYFVGMHLDSWDRAPLRRRHKSRNRICINLGREERFFLFINLPLMQMFEALGFSDDEVYKHYRGTTVGDEFMKKYPDYPVVKLKVAPREAYIAPTDNLIHDASSVGKQYPDITLSFIGYFGIPFGQNQEH
ncbi:MULTISPECIES: hypothetical protein [Nostocales]|uniref:Uncharacterized protein n=3 Tax=Nostocales TaxID=1161 RepID=A0A8S9SXZ2_9CYAN|nr:hypothetical protein [Tolypothrix bouteillei]KAF3884617.1 hypothetical protein DA73_0400003345 [Tolypothrix bouteillei VB521301]